MKKVLTTAAAAGLLAATPVQAQEFVGDWNGVLEAGGGQLTLVLHVTADEEGTLTATMDSPDQGAYGIPASGVETSGDSITVSFDAVPGGGQYAGTMGEDGESLSGTWSQAGQSFPLELTRGEMEEARRPQHPSPPYPYDEEEVRFAGGAADVELAGTLTLPSDGAPHAGVVLVSGSGPQDRDEQVFGHRPFGSSPII